MSNPKACERCGATIESSPNLEGLCAACLFKASLEPEVVVTRGAERRPAPSIASLTPHFPDLEILELIGQGGMGAVYRVRQKSLGRDAALKVLALDGESDPAFGERFEREARLLASLAHPNIVSVYGAGRAGPHWYLLMELVEGASLRQMIAAREVDPRTALAIVGQVCDALQAAHDRGVVHRDIKPENVIVTRKGGAKILDFGLAKLVGQGPRTAHTLTETGQVMGTVRYMAPEQWDRPLSVDHRADIYSLGVVMYELLTGELPMGRFPLPSSKGRVGANVDQIVLKTLEKEPAQRYQQASEVRNDVERAAKAPEAGATSASSEAAKDAAPRESMRERLHSADRTERRARMLRTFALLVGWVLCLIGLGALALGAIGLFSARIGVKELLVLAGVTALPILLGAAILLYLRSTRARRDAGLPLGILGCIGLLFVPLALVLGGFLFYQRLVTGSALAERERAMREARAAMEASIHAEIESMPLVVPGEISSTLLFEDGLGVRRYSGIVQLVEQARLAPFARLMTAGTSEAVAHARWATVVWAMHVSLLDLTVAREKTTKLDGDVVTYRIPALAKQLERNRMLAKYLFVHEASFGTLDQSKPENYLVFLPAGRLLATEASLFWSFDLTRVDAELLALEDPKALDVRYEQALADLGLAERMEFGREEWRVEIRGAHSPAPTGRITLPDGSVRELDTRELTSRYGILVHLAR